MRAPRERLVLLAGLPDDRSTVAGTNGRRRGRNNRAAVQLAPWRSTPGNKEEEEEDGHGGPEPTLNSRKTKAPAYP